VGRGGEGGAANVVVLGSGPETEDDQIGMMILPPEWVADVLLGNPEDGKFGRFRISDFGMGTGIWGGSWFGRRVDDEKGVVAEVTESFCQKAEVAVPEKLVRADSEVGVEEDFQNIPFANKRQIRAEPKS
jgi:hypothetical protein